jgi:hypothetical protein
LKNYRETDKQVGEFQLQAMTLDQISDYLRNSQNDFSKVPSSLTIENLTLEELITGYNQLQLEREAYIKENIPAGNPIYSEVEEKIKLLKSRIIENISNIKSSLNRNINELHRSNQSTEAQLKLLPVKNPGLL